MEKKMDEMAKNIAWTNKICQQLDEAYQ